MDKLLSMGQEARAFPVMKASPELIVQLTEMGFNEEVATTVLLATNNDIEEAMEKALALLSSGTGTISDIGSDDTKTTTTSTTTTKGGEGDSVMGSINEDEEIARRLQQQEEEILGKRKFTGEAAHAGSVLSNTDTNFFIGLIGYVRARLANYSRFCSCFFHFFIYKRY